MPTMFIMRGLPGSGKSTLAKKVARENHAEIHSADDWFMRSGKYVFKPEQLAVAHSRCQHYVRTACKAGKNVVVDNTNTSRQELDLWLGIAKEHGYEVQVVVPDWTPELRTADGKWNVEFLSGKNTHGVPDAVLVSMRDRWED